MLLHALFYCLSCLARKIKMSQFNPIKTLEGQNLIIRELRHDDFDEMFAVSSDKKIWEQTPYSNRYELAIFTQWFNDAIDGQALAITNKHNGQIIGSSRYYETDFEKGEISIGYTFLIREHWGGITNRELKELMFGHAWEYFDTVWLHIAEDNIRSRKAAEKIGAKLNHTGIKNGLPYCWYILSKGTI